MAVLSSSLFAGERPELGETLKPSREIVYKKVGDRELRLFVFEPTGHTSNDARPALLAIHGGGWAGGAPNTEFYLANAMAERGMIGFALEYRLIKGKASTVFECVKDGRSAVRYLRSHAKELGIDPNRIVVAGGSAGGHVAASTALLDEINESSDDLAIDPHPNVLILRYAVLDTSKEGYGSGTIGARWKELSPLHHVRKNMPPALLFHGTADTVTPYKNATDFRDAMIAAGNKCELITAEGATHGHVRLDPKRAAQAVVDTVKFLNGLGYKLKG
ncbi:MAG TPA: alpha/beta hydrolase [Planctomycetota bacterium]|nr:alpha/beta hydrolase [Planctomycetota bacterium]